MNKRAPIYFLNFVSLALMALLPACMKPGEFFRAEKEITNFVFKEANNDDVLTKDEVGEISETTIDVDATYYTDKQSLIASFDVSEGATVKVGDVVQESGKTRNNFSGEVTYTVIAKDGTSQDYKVNVTFSASSKKEIVSFVFEKANNTNLTKDRVGVISGNTISVRLLYGTDAGSLKASFDVSEGATVKVDEQVQESGTTVNDFNNGEVTYKVIAKDGISNQDYKVNVEFSDPSKNEIVSFVFEKANNTNLTKDGVGVISGDTISVRLPYGTDAGSLKASFDVSEGATVKIGNDDQESGKTENNFSGEVTYKVIAQNGTSQDYTVNVRTAPSMSVSSYYLSSDRIGAGDLEKPDLFEISDIVDGDHDYSLKIGGLDAVTGKLTATGGTATLGGGVLPASDWKSIGDGAISIILTIGINNNEFTYSTTKEQYKIKSWQDLQGMKYNSNGSYTLMNDIELPDPSTTGGTFPAELPAEGFEPVGGKSKKFKGSFNGQDHVISNFFINRGSTDYVGLFGNAKGTTIKDVGIEISSGGVTGKNYVGGLVGTTMERGTITNSYAKGAVTGNNYVGGLLGYAGISITITNSYATGDVNGRKYIGGLAGFIEHSITITNCYVIGGNVTGTDDYVGGLVGRAMESGTITNSYAKVNVTGNNHVGGLVGDCTESTTITNSHATGNVNGNMIVGGLVGVLGAAGQQSYIYRSYATGSVNGTDAKEGYVGGLVGRFFRGTISDSYATGSVSGNRRVGGLFGRIHYENAFTKRTYATGTVTATGVNPVLDEIGGLGGNQSGGGDTHSYWDISSTGQTLSSIGTGVSSGSNLVEIEGKYYDTDPSPEIEVFIDWKFGDDNSNPWKWEGNGQWPTLYWQ